MKLEEMISVFFLVIVLFCAIGANVVIQEQIKRYKTDLDRINEAFIRERELASKLAFKNENINLIAIYDVHREAIDDVMIGTFFSEKFWNHAFAGFIH